jgi:DNA-directed RNA polymerase I, II, and III subunit RPABC4
LPQDIATPYICGNCGEEVKLKPSEPIVCRSCGFRILSKKRTNRVVQFEAR